jgi:hypothetical protein
MLRPMTVRLTLPLECGRAPSSLPTCRDKFGMTAWPMDGQNALSYSAAICSALPHEPDRSALLIDILDQSAAIDRTRADP